MLARLKTLGGEGGPLQGEKLWRWAFAAPWVLYDA